MAAADLEIQDGRHGPRQRSNYKKKDNFATKREVHLPRIFLYRHSFWDKIRIRYLAGKYNEKPVEVTGSTRQRFFGRVGTYKWRLGIGTSYLLVYNVV